MRSASCGTSALVSGTRWVKKHGNVRTRLRLLDATDPHRLRLRVIDPDGSTAYKRGREITMDTYTLTMYYERKP